jgi:hypothetical protein
MVKSGPKSTQPRRTLVVLCSALVAGGALAYSTSGGQHGHDEAHGKIMVARIDGGDSQESGGGEGGSGGGAHRVHQGPEGVPIELAHYGPGDGADDPHSGGFMPNGEDGLMAIGDYARGQDAGADNGNTNSDNNPGAPPGGPDTPAGFGGDGSPPVESDNNSGDFGLGGGGGGGGFAGGSGGGGSGGSGGSGGTTPPGGSGDGPGGGSGGNGGGKVCVVSAFDTCGQSPTDGPTAGPRPSIQPLGDPPGNGPLKDPNPGGGVAGVPEPSSWLMIILGLGAAGSALRAQPRRVHETLT